MVKAFKYSYSQHKFQYQNLCYKLAWQRCVIFIKQMRNSAVK